MIPGWWFEMQESKNVNPNKHCLYKNTTNDDAEFVMLGEKRTYSKQ